STVPSRLYSAGLICTAAALTTVMVASLFSRMAHPHPTRGIAMSWNTFEPGWRCRRRSDSGPSSRRWRATVVTTATPVTIALDPATVVTAGAQVAHLLAVNLRILIVSDL